MRDKPTRVGVWEVGDGLEVEVEVTEEEDWRSKWPPLPSFRGEVLGVEWRGGGEP